MSCGVLQGSILGPLLFLLYLNDMPQAVNSELLLYADDTCLIYMGKDTKTIEEQLNRDFKVARNKKIEIFSHCYLIEFNERNRMSHFPPFLRYRYPIEITPQIFYFSYFSREPTVQESLMAPFFGQKFPNCCVFEGL